MAVRRAPLVSVLREARALLTRPDNDSSWSSWEDAAQAARKTDALIARAQGRAGLSRPGLEVLFAPTGPIQEVSLSSGWPDEFLDLTRRFNLAMRIA